MRIVYRDGWSQTFPASARIVSDGDHTTFLSAAGDILWRYPFRDIAEAYAL